MEQKPQKRKVMMTLDEDFYNWLVDQAKTIGIKVAPFCVVLLHEARAARENKEVMMKYLSKFGDLTPEQFQQLLAQVPDGEDVPPSLVISD